MFFTYRYQHYKVTVIQFIKLFSLLITQNKFHFCTQKGFVSMKGMGELRFIDENHRSKVYSTVAIDNLAWSLAMKRKDHLNMSHTGRVHVQG